MWTSVVGPCDDFTVGQVVGVANIKIRAPTLPTLNRDCVAGPTTRAGGVTRKEEQAGVEAQGGYPPNHSPSTDAAGASTGLDCC